MSNIRANQIAIALILCCLGGCAQPTKFLDRPATLPRELSGRQLYHTEQGYIYARNDKDAAEADRWVKEVKDYIQRTRKQDLPKGIVILRYPGDLNEADSLDAMWALERDPVLYPTQPRHPKPLAEVKAEMAKQGIPEAAMVRGATLAVTRSRLNTMGLSQADAMWAVSAPSHELAAECGKDVLTAALRKQKPEWSEEQAREAAGSSSWLVNKAASVFEIPRGQPVFVLWAEQASKKDIFPVQKDGPDGPTQKAILAYLKHVLRSNWLPVPSDEELEW